MIRRPVLAGLALLAVLPAVAAPRPARGGAPAANFLVEWRLEPVAAPASGGGWVVGSADAAGHRSGLGPDAVVVGTAPVAAPQSARVANGQEAAIAFDTMRTRIDWTMAWSSAAAASATTGGYVARGGGVAGEPVTVHQVDGLRVTPHWTRGDTLRLDLAVRHGEPAGGTDGRDQAALDVRTTVELAFDDWQPVATFDGGRRELQLRVRWR